MRFTTPEIAWHNRDPVYSIDIQPCLNISSSDGSTKTIPFLPGVNAGAFATFAALNQPSQQNKTAKSDEIESIKYRIVSAGADSSVVVWQCTVNFCHPSAKIKVDPVAQLARHDNAVNVVRFVPTGEDTFASASVDRSIIIWKREVRGADQMSNKKSPAKQSPGKLSQATANESSKKEDPEIEIIEDKSAKMDESASAPLTSSQQGAKPIMIKSSKPGKRITLTTVTPAPSEQIPNISEPKFGSEVELICDEHWTQWKCFRGHLEDVVDISWSSDGLHILSGSVDNEAILWDINKGTRLAFLSGHKGWVQGVAIDPLNSYLATMSCDRILRIFNFSDRKIVHKVEKASVCSSNRQFSTNCNVAGIDNPGSFILPSDSPVDQRKGDSPAKRLDGNEDVDQKNSQSSHEHFKTKLFYDYTLQSFARRLFFSPDGEFLLVPSGVIEFPRNDKDSKKDKDSSKEKDANEEKENELDKPTIVIDDDDNEMDQTNDVSQLGEEPMDVSLPLHEESTLSSQNSEPQSTNNTPKSKRKASTTNAESTSAVKSKNQETNSSAPDTDSGYINACHVFMRSNLSKPVAYFPLFNTYCHAVRFCPIRFTLDKFTSEKSSESSRTTFPFPYRLVFAVATHKSVIIYDTQHNSPIAYLNDIHYARITDLTWAKDGRLLMISSTDGFVTFVTFDKGELGEIYDGPVYVAPEPAKLSQSKTNEENQQEADPVEVETKPKKIKPKPGTPKAQAKVKTPSAKKPPAKKTTPAKAKDTKPSGQPSIIQLMKAANRPS